MQETHWFNGYAKEIAEAVVDYGIRTLGFSRIQASTDAENVASVHVLDKIGFRYLKRDVDEGSDQRFYELDRHEAI